MRLRDNLQNRHYQLISMAIALPLIAGVSKGIEHVIPDKNPIYRTIYSFSDEELKMDSTYEEQLRSVRGPLMPTRDEVSFLEEGLDYESIYSDIRRHEGVRARAYEDSRGVRTIGVGFNLEEEDAREKIEALGLNYESVFRGEQILSDYQINFLMEEDVETAINDATNYVGRENWEGLEREGREIIINMAYNLGRNRLSGFVRLREALVNRDYVSAAEEMEDSRWYHQVGNRSRELVERMRNIGTSE
jgi:lysozyme